MRVSLSFIMLTGFLATILYGQITEYPHVMDNGGGGASNGAYKQIASIGQAVIGIAGSVNYSNQAGYITVAIGPYLGIKEEPQKEKLPIKFELGQNIPNPFNASTIIKFSLTEDCEFTFNVYNSLGEKVHTETHFKKTGRYIVEFNAGNLPSGVYLYELKAGNNIARKKMMLIK